MTRFRLLPALLLGALVVAVSGCADGNALSLLSGGWPGVCGLIHIVFVVMAFVKLANSSADTGSKVLWGAILFFFPFFGLIAWWFWGPKG